MEWYVKVLKNYAGFEGRARRKEYWMFFLFNFIIAFVLGFVSGILGIGGYLYGLYALVMFIPTLAVGARRLHDIGKSGWLQLIGLIPFVGGIILIVLFCMEGEGDNKYGINPKASSYSGINT